MMLNMVPSSRLAWTKSTFDINEQLLLTIGKFNRCIVGSRNLFPGKPVISPPKLSGKMCGLGKFSIIPGHVYYNQDWLYHK